MFERLERLIRLKAPAVDYWSVRLVEEQQERMSMRQDILQPVSLNSSRGIFVHLRQGGGEGYAASADLTEEGIADAFHRAQQWARLSAPMMLYDPATLPTPRDSGRYASRIAQAWHQTGAEEKLTLLETGCRGLKLNDKIVDWSSFLLHRRMENLFLNSHDARIEQEIILLGSGLRAVAHDGQQTQVRSGGGYDAMRQGGLEHLAELGFPSAAERIGEEALQLLQAEECADGCMDLILSPSQMTLQIHESIGHPLELDRILGDERNYAGTSFVTKEMFGNYQYGSELLNVTFDPTLPQQMASYGYDDEGFPAQKEYLIRNGVLERPLGSASAQARAGLPGTANARASSWNRPPMDRMANINLEAGDSHFEELVGQVELGVFMDTNRSWSIDDSRNKFQFGCEFGRMIRNGELAEVVRNPNYRGISANFWRNLAGVGNAETFEVCGTPNCGKGEPNQVIHVGHASPACLFRQVSVFGGE